MLYKISNKRYFCILAAKFNLKFLMHEKTILCIGHYSRGVNFLWR
jgi:hypothetical protein